MYWYSVHMNEQHRNGYHGPDGEPFWRNEAQRVQQAAKDSDLQKVLEDMHQKMSAAKGNPAARLAIMGAMNRLEIALDAVTLQFDLQSTEFRNEILKAAQKIYWETHDY